MNGWLVLLLSVVVAGAQPAGRGTWGDWMVGGDDADTGASILLRRITPKSVFVAPTFTGCSEGYKQDSLGRCVKLVKVNPQSQWNFFLERLNSMYAPTSSSNKPHKEAGPFHINLPLGSEEPQESVVQKRLPPPPLPQVKIPASTQPPTTLTTTTTTTTTTLPPPTSTLPPTTTMSEPTTAEVSLSTVVEPAEVTSTEKDAVSSTETTAETRRDTTTEDINIAVMLGDQPFAEPAAEPEDGPFAEPAVQSLNQPFAEQAVESSNQPFAEPALEPSDQRFAEPAVDLPKSQQQLQDKPFLIIVTNPTVTRGETTPTFLPDEDETSTTEATTEATSERNEETSKLDEVSERDSTESSIRPVTLRPCRDGAFQDCSVETEVSSDASSLPGIELVDPSSQVRFPSEALVPVRKTQSYVRFPESEEQPPFWWPSWQIRRYPGIHGWPESDPIHGSTDRIIQRKYPYGTTWSSVAWQRRFLQRD